MLHKNGDKRRWQSPAMDITAVIAGLMLGSVLIALGIHALWGPFYLWMLR
jgi:hypothetical protein